MHHFARLQREKNYSLFDVFTACACASFQISNGYFTWVDGAPTLSNVDIKIPFGEHQAVPCTVRLPLLRLFLYSVASRAHSLTVLLPLLHEISQVSWRWLWARWVVGNPLCYWQRWEKCRECLELSPGTGQLYFLLLIIWCLQKCAIISCEMWFWSLFVGVKKCRYCCFISLRDWCAPYRSAGNLWGWKLIKRKQNCNSSLNCKTLEEQWRWLNFLCWDYDSSWEQCWSH